MSTTTGSRKSKEMWVTPAVVDKRKSDKPAIFAKGKDTRKNEDERKVRKKRVPPGISSGRVGEGERYCRLSQFSSFLRRITFS
jgi:hypothetical protein